MFSTYLETASCSESWGELLPVGLILPNDDDLEVHDDVGVKWANPANLFVNRRPGGSAVRPAPRCSW